MTGPVPTKFGDVLILHSTKAGMMHAVGEKAEAIRPPGNDIALLRWNTCAGLIMRDHHLVPAAEEPHEPLFLE
jgi:hypothetical protein